MSSNSFPQHSDPEWETTVEAAKVADSQEREMRIARGTYARRGTNIGVVIGFALATMLLLLFSPLPPRNIVDFALGWAFHGVIGTLFGGLIGGAIGLKLAKPLKEANEVPPIANPR